MSSSFSSITARTDGGGQPRRSGGNSRGVLSRLFFGRSRRADTDAAAAAAAAAAAEEEAAAAAAASMPNVTNEPVFTRALPTLDEFPEIVRRLQTFDWDQRIIAYDGFRMHRTPLPAAASAAAAAQQHHYYHENTYAMPHEALSAADHLVTLTLQQLCTHYLGRPPSVPSSRGAGGKGGAPAELPEYIQNQYKGTEYLNNKDLTDYLKRVLMGTTGVPYMSSTQKAILERPIEFSQDVRDRMVNMYPHIMVLIKALLVHLCQHTDEEHSDSASLRHTVLRIWRDVLGDLDALRIVLVRADEMHVIDLGECPRIWTEFIRETVDHVHACQQRLHTAEEEGMGLRTLLLERQKALNELAVRFDDPLHKFQMIQAERARLQDALDETTNVQSVLRSYDVSAIPRLLSIGAEGAASVSVQQRPESFVQA
jgi:hypothetical protein